MDTIDNLLITSTALYTLSTILVVAALCIVFTCQRLLKNDTNPTDLVDTLTALRNATTWLIIGQVLGSYGLFENIALLPVEDNAWLNYSTLWRLALWLLATSAVLFLVHRGLKTFTMAIESHALLTHLPPEETAKLR